MKGSRTNGESPEGSGKAPLHGGESDEAVSNGRRKMRVVVGGRLASPPLRRGVYVLPNLITTASLFSGVYSIIACLRGDFVIASVAVIVANVFDVLDGRIARVTKTESQFGIEYDSLADLVAFGVAPGALVYHWGLEPWGTWGWLAVSLFVACGALRLARFNVQYENAEKRLFVGLPIPAAGSTIAATILLHQYLGGVALAERSFVVLLMVYALAVLMVSGVRYWSFKEFHLHRRQPFWVLVTVIILLMIFIAEPQFFLFTGGWLFALSGPARWVFLRSRRALRRRSQSRAREGLTKAGIVL